MDFFMYESKRLSIESFIDSPAQLWQGLPFFHFSFRTLELSASVRKSRMAG